MIPAKPKLLFVDDRSKRIHAALKRYGKDYEVTIAPNVPEALRLLSAQEWDIVSLDFDLDGNDFNDPDSKTCAMEIIRYLQKTVWGARKVPEFLIHTHNNFGASLLVRGIYSIFGPKVSMVRLPFSYEE